VVAGAVRADDGSGTDSATDTATNTVPDVATGHSAAGTAPDVAAEPATPEVAAGHIAADTTVSATVDDMTGDTTPALATPAEADANADASSNAAADTAAGARAEADAGAAVGTAAGAEIEADASAGTDADAKVAAEADVEIEADAGAEAEAEANAGADAEVEAEANAGAGAGADPAPSGAESRDLIPWRDLDEGVYVRMLGRLGDDPDISRLLDHCANGASPGSGRTRAMIEAAPDAAAALILLVGKEEPAGPTSVTFVLGLIKALALLPAEDAVPLLSRLAAQESGLTAGSMPLARSAIRALAAVPGELVPPALHRLASESSLAALRKAAYAELKRRLPTPADAPEWTVDTFGLDATSRTRVEVGPDHVAVVRVETGGQVVVVYHDTRGRALAGKPTASTLDPEAMRGVTELAANLRTAVRAARTRLESAQKERREITTADWLDHYLAHPLTGRLARTLFWEMRAGEDGEWTKGLPREDDGRWSLVTPTGDQLVPGDGDVLRVAAPVRLPAQRAKEWNRLLTTAKVKPVLPQIRQS